VFRLSPSNSEIITWLVARADNNIKTGKNRAFRIILMVIEVGYKLIHVPENTITQIYFI